MQLVSIKILNKKRKKKENNVHSSGSGFHLKCLD